MTELLQCANSLFLSYIYHKYLKCFASLFYSLQQMSCWLTGSSDAIWKVYTLNKSRTKFESNWPYLHVLQKIYKFHRKTEYFKPLINIKLQLILNLDVGVFTIWKKYVASNCGHLGCRPRLSNEISKQEMSRINPA